MKIKYHISFKLRPFGRKTVKYQIRMRFTFNAQRTDIATGWNLDNRDAWNENAELVNAGYVGSHGEKAADINARLANQKGQLEMAFSYFEALDIIPLPSEVVAKYNERMGGIVPKKPDTETPKKENSVPSFFKVYEQFLSECGEKNAWTEATFEKMNSLREDLMTFRKGLRFSDLTEAGLTDFVKYLRYDKKLKTPRKAKGERQEYDTEDVAGLKNSTIAKKLDFLRWFLNWASEKGYNTNLDYKHFRPTLKKTQKKVIFFTKEELTLLKNLVLPSGKEYLESVRDVFFFCCFSGLRHSDAVNLRRSDVKDGQIDVTTVKTADSISIELNNVTKGILEKYKDFPFKENRALPPLTNQAMNRNIKELCRLAGIDEEIRITTYKGNQRKDEVKRKWELVGTHTGRRTFIVNALSLGIPADVVMKWTGHADYKSMRPYIDIVDNAKVREMTKMNFMD